MTRPTRGKKFVLFSGVALAVLLAGTAWLGWDRIRFWWLFKPLGENEQGHPEYRHRQTGIVLVRLPGDVATLGEARSIYHLREITLPPFLIGKYEISQAEWRRVMGQNPLCIAAMLSLSTQ